MTATSPGLVAAELLLLVVLLAPLGLLALRIGERVSGFRPRLLPVERALLGLYLGGFLLFVIASTGLSLFTLDVVVGLLLAAAGVMIALWWSERGRTFVASLHWLASWTGLVVVAGFFGVLALEIYGVSGFSFSNAYDGATHSLWINVILRSHGVPWTVRPFADVGITYPQAAPVWEALPPLLFGWAIPESPVYLPALFFALSVPAAYSLGARLSDGAGCRPETSGALFAAFFAIDAAFPRLFLGGSYDLTLAFPLFLVLLGWLPWFLGLPRGRWAPIAAFAIAAGIATSLSWMLGLETLTLVAGFEIVRVLAGRTQFVPAAARFLSVLAASAVVLARSLVGTARWWAYPGRVLSAVGSRPYASVSPGSPLTYRYVTGELDPFILFKARLSPVPWMSVIIAILLAFGIGLLVLGFAVGSRRLRRLVSMRLAKIVSLATLITFLDVTILVVLAAPGSGLADVTTLTNADELSVVLFLLFGLVALIPLLAAAAVLEQRVPRSRTDASRSTETAPHGPRGTPGRARLVTVVATAVLLIGFGAGGVSTVADLPSYIHDHVQSIANVTPGDVGALEWAAAHLPSCSRVFVAPGSAAEYLPEYATVGIVFPAFPAVYNLSYASAISALVNGTYDPAVRADLSDLAVDAVFVTGRTTVQFPPLNATPLLRSSDFSVAYQSGDAWILEFLPGASETGCPIPLGVG